ncbi:DUF4350 domain-containing protein [uncultured Stenotrophomonas sp.]|uniref:DUF4350 domain-containing protein n=1 Tax=uncultured Stenotrophomonas sp. TaxID=165438 RepID=UPI0028E803AB|nr:DUF4350 domain-containing protein [uncultured Stenotrophomonas sp.]
MSARLRWLLVLGVLLALGVPLAIVFLRTHEKVTHTEHLPPQGEASYNPLYVLGQALRADGLGTHGSPRIDLPRMQLAPGDTVLLLQDSVDVPAPTAQALLAWVERGGHLLLRTSSPYKDDDTAQGPLLDALGVDTEYYEGVCKPFHVADDPGHSEFCAGLRFGIDPPEGLRVEREWGDDDGLVFVRLRKGAGTIDVLSDMEFLKGTPRMFNAEDPKASLADGLHDTAHRDLTRYLLEPNYGKGTVWLIYGSRPPTLWSRIFYQGWPVWVPLLLALLGWLWQRAQRLGSELPAPATERRSLLEHVRGSGEHLLRYGKAPLLYDAVRRAFLARLRRRAPTAAALSGEAQVHAIATLLQWPHTRVQTALQVPASKDVAALRDRIRLLIQMRNLL